MSKYSKKTISYLILNLVCAFTLFGCFGSGSNEEQRTGQGGSNKPQITQPTCDSNKKYITEVPSSECISQLGCEQIIDIEPAFFAKISASDLSKIKEDCLGQFKAEQLVLLQNDQIVSLLKDRYKKVDFKNLAQAQVGALIQYVSSEDFKSLDPSILHQAKIEDFKESQLKEAEPSLFSSAQINNFLAAKKYPIDRIKDLPKTYVQNLNLNNLEIDQLQAVDVTKVDSKQEADILNRSSDLLGSQINALPKTIQKKINFESLTDVQLAEINWKHLSDAQRERAIPQMSRDALDNLDWSKLNPEQKKHVFPRLSDSRRQTVLQRENLDTFDFSVLTHVQLIQDLRSLEPRKIGRVLSRLANGQFEAAIQDAALIQKADLSRLANEKLIQLNYDLLTVPQRVDLARTKRILQNDKKELLSVEGLGSVVLSEASLQILSSLPDPELQRIVSKLSAEQLLEVSDLPWAKIDPRDLSPEQIQKLDPGKFTHEQLQTIMHTKNLYPESHHFSALRDLKKLKGDILQDMDPVRISEINGEVLAPWLQHLGPAHLRNLSIEQLKYLFEGVQLEETLTLLEPNQLEHLPHDQKKIIWDKIYRDERVSRDLKNPLVAHFWREEFEAFQDPHEEWFQEALLGVQDPTRVRFDQERGLVGSHISVLKRDGATVLARLRKTQEADELFLEYTLSFLLQTRAMAPRGVIIHKGTGEKYLVEKNTDFWGDTAPEASGIYESLKSVVEPGNALTLGKLENFFHDSSPATELIKTHALSEEAVHRAILQQLVFNGGIRNSLLLLSLNAAEENMQPVFSHFFDFPASSPYVLKAASRPWDKSVLGLLDGVDENQIATRIDEIEPKIKNKILSRIKILKNDRSKMEGETICETLNRLLSAMFQENSIDIYAFPFLHEAALGSCGKQPY